MTTMTGAILAFPRSREHVDFSVIPERHVEIDKRLANWGAWCRGSGGAGGVSPMFRLYRSSQHWRNAPISSAPAVDEPDAARMQRAVAALPEPHRHALHWFYVHRSAPRRACQLLGTTMQGLAQYVNDGRTMLLNRGA